MQVEPTSPTRSAPEHLEADEAARRAEHAPRRRRTSPAVWIPVLLVLVAGAGVGGWLAMRGDGSGGPAKQATSRPAGVSAAQLSVFAAKLGHPVYWAGAGTGLTYELTRTRDGRVYIRYLPIGVKIGTGSSKYLTVGTYPQANAFSTLQAAAKLQKAQTIPLPGGGLAFQDPAHLTSFYAAYPGSDYQIEVYDPSSIRVVQLLTAGLIVPVPTAKPASSAATPAQLSALATKLGHPLFWAGPQPSTTYELTQTTGGGVYVRYLPKGVQVGTTLPSFVTIGTYPLARAFATLKAQAKAGKAGAFTVGHGGIAIVNRAHPTSIYVAYPGLDFQIEVYAPTAAQARQLVRSGELVRIG